MVLAKENLILKLKKKKEQLSPKPLRIRRNENPFKKTKEADQIGSDGVSEMLFYITLFGK